MILQQGVVKRWLLVYINALEDVRIFSLYWTFKYLSEIYRNLYKYNKVTIFLVSTLMVSIARSSDRISPRAKDTHRRRMITMFAMNVNIVETVIGQPNFLCFFNYYAY
jgi:hypothetical protein